MAAPCRPLATLWNRFECGATQTVSLSSFFSSRTESSMSSSTGRLQVGIIVRAQHPTHPKALRRAVIATLDDNNVCVLWEDEAPRAISAHPFLVAPVMQDAVDDVESELPRHSVASLLDFETTKTEVSESIAVWKERGDTLLRLGDASAAVGYYEHALHLSSKLSEGSSVLIKVKGYIKVAEVDCIESRTVDVTLLEAGDEMTLNRNDVLMTILEPDSDRMQERILLNLGRCLLQLADTTTLTRRPRYLKSAVLAASMALSLAEFVKNPASTNLQTSLLLRCQAQTSLSKFSHATADAKRMLSLDPHNKQAQKLLKDIARQQSLQKKNDKKLAKEMCKWVQTATNGPVSDNEDDNEQKNLTPQPRIDHAPHFLSPAPAWLLGIVAGLLLAFGCRIFSSIESDAASRER